MLVVRSTGSLRLITQADQAALAVRLLSLWLLDGVPQHPRRAELLAAVRGHGLGWQGADAAPTLDSRGRPCSMSGLPPAALVRIFEETLDRIQGRGWVALVVRGYLREQIATAVGPGSGELIARIEEAQARALEAASESSGRGIGRLEADLAEDIELVRTVDAVSQVACGVPVEVAPQRLRAQATAKGVALSPFPLAGPTTLRLAAREIADRRYESLGDLVAALGRARWQTISILFEPLTSG